MLNELTKLARLLKNANNVYARYQNTLDFFKTKDTKMTRRRNGKVLRVVLVGQHKKFEGKESIKAFQNDKDVSHK